jgi:hypothetical protein
MNNITADDLDKTLKHLFEHQYYNGENAVGRWELVAVIYGAGADEPRNDSNVLDRAVRDGIMRLRLQGVMIIEGLAGRHLATSQEEYESWKEDYLKPFYTRREVVSAMDKAAAQKWPSKLQPALFPMSRLELP